MLNLKGFDRLTATLSLMGVIALAPEAFAQVDAKEGAEEEAQSSKGGSRTPASLLPSLLNAQPAEGAAAAEGEGAAEAEKEEGVEEIVLTGSRIKRKDLTTPAPITIIDTNTINASGLVSVGDILQQLPANQNGINVQFNNGGDGTTRVNLRGLGAARTLVLINGRRVVPGGLGANSSVDLNIVPVEIIDRIEVLRDGGSALYGSDAIGGVVNVITKRDFSGLEAQAYYGASEHGGLFFQGSVTAGHTTEKSSFLVNGQYFRQDALFAGQRDFARSDLAYTYANGNQTGLGSSAPPESNIVNRQPGLAGNRAWQAIDQGGGVYHRDNATGFRPWNPGGTSDVGEGDLYNYQPENYLVTPSERFSLFMTGDYRINDKLEVFVEGLYSNRQSDRLLAPEPLFLLFIGDGIPVSGNSIYNPYGRDFIDVRRRMIESSNRRFIASTHAFRVVTGLRGDFPDDMGKLSTWNWEFSFNYGRFESAQITQGVFVASRLANAVGPSFIDDTLTARCGTPGNVISGCVPLNLFGGPGTVTQAMLDYSTFTGTRRGFSDQRILTFETGGEIFDLWNRPASLVLGVQQRNEGGGNLPNAIVALGDSTGNNQLPTEGSYNEFAFYAELGIPLLADLPLVELLEVNAAFRVFDFDTFGTDFMYKVGGLWKVYSDVSIRGNVSRSFRAPSVSELFAGAADGFPAVTDPCDTSTARSAIEETNCVADGLPTTQQGFVTGQAQIRTIGGGNTGLQPETADIITAGIVWTPTFVSFMRGFSATVDYFNINIDNAIGTVTPNVILNNCYSRDDGTRGNCDQITRNASGLITQIDDRNTNVGGVTTSGIDIALNYQKGTPIGRFNLGLNGVYALDFTQTQADGQEVSGLDQYDLGDGLGFLPSWKFNILAQYQNGGFNLGYNFRYIRGVRECDNNDCSDGSNNLVRGVPSNITMDVFAGYSFSTPIGFTTIRGGINNFTDQTPPVIYEGFLANSDAATYDYLGRFYYVSLRHRL